MTCFFFRLLHNENPLLCHCVDFTEIMTQIAHKPKLPSTVWVLGWVSLLMDISSEMIHALLPLFMVNTLGAGMIWIGVVEGIGEGAALVTKVFSGVIADRFGHKKWLVFAGYFLGVVSKPIFALATSMPGVLGARLFDRIGKGIRGAPRDAIVAEVTDEKIRGAAFGLRQSLDAAGAFVGPLLATGLLYFWTQDLRTLFWVALIPGVACLLLINFGVKKRTSKTQSVKALPFKHVSEIFTPSFIELVILGVVFSLARFSNAFIVLRAEDLGCVQTWIPLLIVLMNAVFSLASYPLGQMADRVNPKIILSLGFIFLAASDFAFAFCTNLIGLLAAIVLFGLHLAATQGILAAMVSQIAPKEQRATAFGVFNLFCGLALLLSGLLLGVLWQLLGAQSSFIAAGIFAFVSLFFIRSFRLL